MISFDSIVSDIAKVGIVSGIVIYLIWWITSSLSDQISQLNKTITELQERINDLQIVIETLKDIIRKNGK